jgi:hypothetical protein
MVATQAPVPPASLRDAQQDVIGADPFLRVTYSQPSVIGPCRSRQAFAFRTDLAQRSLADGVPRTGGILRF